MTANPFSGKTLAVMLGGSAAERSISLESGENVAHALEQPVRRCCESIRQRRAGRSNSRGPRLPLIYCTAQVVKTARCRGYSSS